MNFKNAYDEYMQFASIEQKKQTIYAYKYDFEKRILPFFKEYNLEQIDSDLILSWKKYILSLNFSNNYNRNLYYILSGFFSYCSIYYGFDKSIISKVGCFKKKYEISKIDYYTLSEYKVFIKGIHEPVYKLFFEFMFFTGCRPGEALALNFNDVQGDYVYISKTMFSHGNREINSPKTNSSIRKIKIDKILKNHILKIKKYYEKKGEIPSFIFGGSKPLSITSINRRKIMACREKNIRPITLHQFRHSHASMLLKNGVLINDISKRLGHGKVSTTLDIYTHTNLEQEKRVVLKLLFLRIF